MSLDLSQAHDIKKSARFLPSQLAKLNRETIPHHIAIIPDGNRRWARRRDANDHEGHSEGADILMEIVKGALELGIKVISFYAFSTENWTRPEGEVLTLMALFTAYLANQRDEMVRCGIKFDIIGDANRLPLFLREEIERTKQATAHCECIRLVLALNYGARDELCRAFKRMLRDCEGGRLNPESVDEQTISRYLDTGDWKDPELLIRTSGEVRISNFLLWQISYSEIHISPVLWPEFTAEHLLNAILDYQEKNRRWGGT
jgi:undecaprenyl diphosphate synthase